jgi:osmotically inducible protein OsmC
MARESFAEATWHGSLLEGNGTIESVGSGAFGPLPVTWASRAEGVGGGTTPEELIAAAHATCFSMALSNILAKAGTPPETLSVSAKVSFVAGTGITASALDVKGVVPGLDEAGFRAAAEEARDGCPVSQALMGNVDLSVAARLE